MTGEGRLRMTGVGRTCVCARPRRPSPRGRRLERSRSMDFLQPAGRGGPGDKRAVQLGGPGRVWVRRDAFMASNYTTNYGLCQWEPGDKFLREEFNGDNRRIDTVVWQTENLAEAASHNVYNLMLQNYYEGKDPRWKKALVFDGFQNEELTASKTAGLLRIQDRLVLTRVGQGDVALGYGSVHSLKNGQTSRTITATGAGKIVGIHFKTNMIGSEAVTVKIACTVYVNGVQSRYETHSVLCPLGDTEQTITLSPVHWGTRSRPSPYPLSLSPPETPFPSSSPPQRAALPMPAKAADWAAPFLSHLWRRRRAASPRRSSTCLTSPYCGVGCGIAAEVWDSL